MSILNRLSRLPLQRHCIVNKWIHSSAVLKMSTKSEPNVSAAATVGRHRSTKLKRSRTIATLPGRNN